MKKIYPVLLAGGSGTRLWPLSRKSYPKQFANLIGGGSLFQQSALRLLSSDLLGFAPHITLTNSDFRFIVREQLQHVNIDPGNILIEPGSKNTAAAILAASLFAIEQEEDAILLVAPSDHIILDTKMFHAAINVGLDYVRHGKIVTFGIFPEKPETAYGYLELDHFKLDDAGTANVLRFIEKPSRANAEIMLKTGNYLWNAGIFLFRASDVINAFERFYPAWVKLTMNALREAEQDLEFLRLNNKYWSQIEDISIDYAIMEKVNNLVAVPYSSKWSDLGGWDSVLSETINSPSGTAISENAHAIECTNTLLRSESSGQQLVGLGLTDIMAIAMPDAVLVAHKNKAQDVKDVVFQLRKNNVPQADIFPKDHRPWGWFESLVVGNCFQVKRICVNPGAALSLQSHKFRSEHWIVVEGEAKVTIDKVVKTIEVGHSIYVPIGAIHRMENPGNSPMILIEVQIGTYLGEDDIVRYEDLYARG